MTKTTDRSSEDAKEYHIYPLGNHLSSFSDWIDIRETSKNDHKRILSSNRLEVMQPKIRKFSEPTEDWSPDHRSQRVGICFLIYFRDHLLLKIVNCWANLWCRVFQDILARIQVIQLIKVKMVEILRIRNQTTRALPINRVWTWKLIYLKI